MRQIIFPLLNLKLNISNIAIKIGDIEIYWYAIIIVSAIIISAIICGKRNGLYDIKFDDVLELLLWAIPVSLICARVYYVIFKLDYYMIYPTEIVNFRNGGLAIYGAIFGAILTAIIFSKNKKIDFLDLADYIIPTLALRTSNRKMGELC